MRPLGEYNKKHDRDPKTPLEIAQDEGKVRKSRKDVAGCDEWERRFVEIATLEQQLHHVYDWQEFFPQSMRYKKPFVLNGHLFTERPSPDGTLPDDHFDHDGQAEDLLTDTSEDEETEVEAVEEEVKPKVKR